MVRKFKIILPLKSNHGRSSGDTRHKKVFGRSKKLPDDYKILFSISAMQSLV